MKRDRVKVGSVLGILFLFSLWQPFSARPQGVSFQLAGYAKNLGIRLNSVFTDDAYFLDISRLRTKGLLDVGSLVHAEVWLDNEVLAGDFLSSPDFRLSRAIQRPTFADLDWTVEEGDQIQVRQALFRAFATVYAGSTELTFGRQRVAWGTGFVWNPTDLLNPFNPVAIELEEKAGVDAAYLATPLGSLSRLEVAFAPGRKRLKSSAALRLSSNFAGYDFSLMAGDFQDDKVVGGDFAGYIGGGGVRGEVAYTWGPGKQRFLRAVLNADYNFPGDFYVFVEFYLNGQGATDRADYDLSDLLSGRTFNLARYYLAGSLSRSVTPLLQVSLYNIWNLVDRSSLVGPSVSYSPAANLEVTASAYLFLGAGDSEYGQLGSSVFGFVQFYF